MPTFLRVSLWTISILVLGCGAKRDSEGESGGLGSSVEKAFQKAAKRSGIPARFMLAAAFLESRMSPKFSVAHYVNPDDVDDVGTAKGTILTETAFGIRLSELGLDPKLETSFTLEVQVEAYAAWLAKRVDVKAIGKPEKPDAIYDWIWAFATNHRVSAPQRQNVQIVFAEEMIQILNEGFIWQDPRNAEVLELDQQKPPIDKEDFPEDAKDWFRLIDHEGEIFIANYLPLVSVPSNEFENNPRRVEVIHCPLSLSTCLELQSRDKESDVHLAAHYLIPQDQGIFSNVIQLARHRQSLVITNKRGEHVPVQDAVVVMLVGNSGRNVDGERLPAIPTWFTDYQLSMMGQVIGAICQKLAMDNAAVNNEACLSTTGDLGVQFRHRGLSEEFRWGDIADYDATIFDAYVRSPGGLGAQVAFEFNKGKKRFKKGDRIPLNVTFNRTARTVELERLKRCRNGRVVWVPVDSDEIRGERRIVFHERVFDSGPNRNGDQFFRARVYGRDAKLIGWAIDQILISRPETEDDFATDRHCGVD